MAAPRPCTTTVQLVRRLAVMITAALVLGACSGGSSGSGKALDGTFEKLLGGQASFADYRGKPVVVNFFSSTCVPCQTEMPALEKTKQQLADQVQFIGMDVNDTVEAGQAFAESTGVTWD